MISCVPLYKYVNLCNTEIHLIFPECFTIIESMYSTFQNKMVYKVLIKLSFIPLQFASFLTRFVFVLATLPAQRPAQAWVSSVLIHSSHEL